MLKRILTILLCITLLCPLLTGATETEELYFEIAEYNDAVGFFTAFGILNRESAFLDTDEWTITRGEFTALALECIGVKDAKSGNFENPYLDVSAEHPYIKEILYATHNGYIGDGLGKFFQPDLPLTTEFAARIAVNMTGRGIMVRSQNYLSLAMKAHLFDDVQVYGESNISRGDALMFMKNTMTVSLVVYDSISSNGDIKGIHIDEEANLLSTVLKYERRRGIMTSDGMTTVFGSNPESGYVTVDGNTFLLLCGGVTGMAGKSVEYYVTEYEGENAIKYVEEYKNAVLTVDAESVTGFDPVAMKYRVLIEEKGKDLSISRSAFISYNHDPYYNPDYMIPEKGSVTFIDHNKDNVYDAVLISEFTNTIVDYYSSYSETIYDINSRKDTKTGKNTDDIDLSDTRDIFLTNMNGTEVDPGLIEKFSIISVYKSNDGKKIRMLVSDEKVTGVLSEIDHEEAIYTIGSKNYKLSADFRSDQSKLNLGEKYTCYLDARGEIAYVTSDIGIMAYLTNAATADGLSDVVEIQALNEESGILEVYKLAKKVRYRTPSSDEKIDRQTLYKEYLIDSSDKFIRTMAIIEFNDDGEVASITTAMDIPTYDALIAAPEYPLYKLSYLITGRPAVSGGNATGNGMEYRDAGDHWNRWIVMGSGAKIFYVPEDGEEIDDPESIVVKKASYSDGNTENADLGFYSKDKNEIAVHYLLKHSKASAAATLENSWPYVVSKIVGCYDDRRGDTYRVTLEGTDTRTLYLKDASVLKKENWAPETDLTKIPEEKTRIEVGDIVYYSTDASEDIDQFLVWWNSRDGLSDSDVSRFGNVTLTTPPETYYKIGPAGGLIERKDGSILEVSLDDLSDEKNTPLADRIQRVNWGKNMSTIMVQYTGKKAEITRDVSATELIPGDRIVFCGRYGKVYVSVIYRR